MQQPLSAKVGIYFANKWQSLGWSFFRILSKYFTDVLRKLFTVADTIVPGEIPLRSLSGLIRIARYAFVSP
jgi:hypothetical protein